MKVATLCYVRRAGRTLMVRRTRNPGDMHWGKWNGLGGKIVPGETPEECVIREVMEESGLAIEAPRLRGILTFPAFDDVDDWYVFLFEADSREGDPGDCPEGFLEWIDDSSLQDLELWEGDRHFMQWMEDGRFFSGKLTYSAGRLADFSVVFHGERGTR